MPYRDRFRRIDQLPPDLPIANDPSLRELLSRRRWDIRPFEENPPHYYSAPKYDLDIVPHAREGVEEVNQETNPLFIDTAHARIREDPNLPGVLRRRPELHSDELSSKVEWDEDPNMLYRGLSDDEIMDMIEHGQLRSRGEHNIGDWQEGLTFFSTDPQQAESYANAFAPYPYIPSFDHPGHIIGIRRPEESRITVHPNYPTEVGVRGPIDPEDIVDSVRLQPYAVRGGYMDLIPSWINNRETYTEGSRSSPRAYVGYAREPVERLGRSASLIPKMTRMAAALDSRGQYDLADRIDHLISLAQEDPRPDLDAPWPEEDDPWSDAPVPPIQEAPWQTTTPTPSGPACPDCGSVMVFFPKARFRPFWGCSKWRKTGCRGAVAADLEGTPLSPPVRTEVRQLREAAHDTFDQLWQGPGAVMSRGSAYRWLQQVMGMSEEDAHIAKFGADECRRVLELVEPFLRQNVSDRERKRREYEALPPKEKELQHMRDVVAKHMQKLYVGPKAIMTREQAYTFMAERLGLTPDEAHVSQLDLSQCKRIIGHIGELRKPGRA